MCVSGTFCPFPLPCQEIPARCFFTRLPLSGTPKAGTLSAPPFLTGSVEVGWGIGRLPGAVALVSTLPLTVPVAQSTKGTIGNVNWLACWLQADGEEQPCSLTHISGFKMFQLVAATNKNPVLVTLRNQQTRRDHEAELCYLVKDKSRVQRFILEGIDSCGKRLGLSVSDLPLLVEVTTPTWLDTSLVSNTTLDKSQGRARKWEGPPHWPFHFPQQCKEP